MPAASPWSKEDLLKPVNSNQYRYCAKHKFKQKIIWQAFLII
ncbi:glycosyltransferase family 8 C-terminal domain-containing protein [Escherichia coli]|nr:glycosyltransferase family 8 C-terminal domain-containing protein [Escherichia coli]MDC9119756.1 glycosyltransferase family 8 C-terminal domain-containing protein [Escherichia coli]